MTDITADEARHVIDTMFSHIVVSHGESCAYFIGTRIECLVYIMANGLRSTTKVIPV